MLQGANVVNKDTPSPFVAQVRASPVGGSGLLQPQQLEVAFASVNGAAACNTCGFDGDVAGQFIGDGMCVRPCGLWCSVGLLGRDLIDRFTPTDYLILCVAAHSRGRLRQVGGGPAVRPRQHQDRRRR